MILALPVPPAAVALPWLEQPTPAELGRVWALFGDASKATTASMDCRVRADGRLEGCRGGDGPGSRALQSLRERFVIDRTRYGALGVNVSVELPKLYDSAPKLTKTPKREELLAYAPSGVVPLQCRITVEGVAADCRQAPEEDGEPSGAGAPTPQAVSGALRAAALYRFKPAQRDGRPLEVEDRFAVVFSKITNPDWLRKPDFSELQAVWPREGVGMDGSARIRCRIGPGGVMTDCQVLTESPPGKGFGSAAMLLAPTFLMKPGTRDGVPFYADTVVIPINFQGGAQMSAVDGQRVSVLTWTAFVAAPSAEAVLAAYPARALAAGVEGKVALRCGIGKTGALEHCDSLLESPRGQGLGAAAEHLASGFRVDLAALPKTPLGDMRVPLAFNFSRDALSADRKLPGIDWVRRVSAEKLVQIYPDQAVEAKVMKGSARVGCTIGPDGALIDCAVRDEAPQGLGFGPAAMAVAGVMKANLWTREGAPTPGAHIVLPVTLVYGGELPK